jgi:signal-transduction protein with cAMP-binding, CBS, and nucleotidyltransferase domain
MFQARGVTILYRLPRRDIELLTTRSEVFFSFCKRRLGVLLDLSQTQLHAMHAQRAAFHSSLTTPPHNLIRRAAVTCQASDALSECLAVMHRQRGGPLLVIDNDAVEMGVPVAGILTRSAVIERLVLNGQPLGDEKVRACMISHRISRWRNLEDGWSELLRSDPVLKQLEAAGASSAGTCRA